MLDTEIMKRCESCGWPLTEDCLHAVDKYGDWLCRSCHIQAVLLLKAEGVIWRGRTFGYELGEAQCLQEVLV